MANLRSKQLAGKRGAFQKFCPLLTLRVVISCSSQSRLSPSFGLGFNDFSRQVSSGRTTTQGLWFIAQGKVGLWIGSSNNLQSVLAYRDMALSQPGSSLWSRIVINCDLTLKPAGDANEAEQVQRGSFGEFDSDIASGRTRRGAKPAAMNRRLSPVIKRCHCSSNSGTSNDPASHRPIPR